jgi:integral membrane sensor domain MASE1
MIEASQPRLRTALLADRLLLALLVGTAAWLSLTLTRAPGSVSAVWVGNGIFVGWL